MKTIAAVVAAVLLLAGCSSGHKSPSHPPSSRSDNTNDMIFLASLSSDFAGVPDADLIATGRTECAAFDAGLTWLAVIKQGIDSGLTPYMAGEMAGASVAVYCPQYHSLTPTG